MTEQRLIKRKSEIQDYIKDCIKGRTVTIEEHDKTNFAVLILGLPPLLVSKKCNDIKGLAQLKGQIKHLLIMDIGNKMIVDEQNKAQLENEPVQVNEEAKASEPLVMESMNDEIEAKLKIDTWIDLSIEALVSEIQAVKLTKLQDFQLRLSKAIEQKKTTELDQIVSLIKGSEIDINEIVLQLSINSDTPFKEATLPESSDILTNKVGQLYLMALRSNIDRTHKDLFDLATSDYPELSYQKSYNIYRKVLTIYKTHEDRKELTPTIS